MAEQLGGLINAVGGPEYASVLLDPLTTLACVEEATVREKAVIALNGLLVALPDTIIERVAWPAIRALATRDWFTSRSAASALLARVMTRLPTKALAVPGAATKDDAFAAFVRLCAADEVAVVRRAAAAQIPDIATALAGGTLPSPESRANASAAAAAAALVGSNSVGAVELDLAEDVSSALPPAAPTPTIVDASSAAAGAAAAVILLPLAQAFARDEQDSVRLLGVLGAIAIARLTNGGMASVTDGSAGARARLADGGAARSAALALLGELSRDRAWRIRWSVAHRLRELAEAIGAPLASSAIVPVLTALCRDSEAEVRAAAAYRIAEVATVVGPAATRSALLPAAEELVGDSSEPVRAALAAVLLGVVPVLGAGVAVDSVLPLFLRLLKDTAPHIRLHALARIDVLASAVPLRSLAPSLLPAVEDLSSARSWRLRAATINFMPALARLLGAEVFETTPTLVDLVLRWLADPVFAIREAAAVNLRALALAFGAPWAERVLMPRVLGLVDAAAAGSASGAASAFQMRMTSLLALIVSIFFGTNLVVFYAALAHSIDLTSPYPFHPHT